jgi:aromatic ring-cleaving dioxygenase
MLTGAVSMSATMTALPCTLIQDWQAHLYFDADSRDDAWALRELIASELAGQMVLGRFHERPVGPHPVWSYQLAIATGQLGQVLGWLALNRGTLDVLIHPNSDDEARDHQASALWLGRPHTLNLAGLHD